MRNLLALADLVLNMFSGRVLHATVMIAGGVFVPPKGPVQLEAEVGVRRDFLEPGTMHFPRSIVPGLVTPKDYYL